MSQNTCDQFNDLVTRIAAAGTAAEGRSHEILNTALAREVLAAIVGGQMAPNPQAPGGPAQSAVRMLRLPPNPLK